MREGALVGNCWGWVGSVESGRTAVLAPLLLVSVKAMPVIWVLEALGRTAYPRCAGAPWDRPSGKGSTPIGSAVATITGVLTWFIVAKVATLSRPGIKDQAVVAPVATPGLSVALVAETE